MKSLVAEDHIVSNAYFEPFDIFLHRGADLVLEFLQNSAAVRIVFPVLPLPLSVLMKASRSSSPFAGIAKRGGLV